MEEERKKRRMPAEFEPHLGTMMIWPVRPGSWPYAGRDAKPAFCEVMRAILEDEKVWLLADKDHEKEARNLAPDGVEVLPIESDDAWARDVGPTFVLDENGQPFGIDWAFNAWGGDVDGLYRHWERDDRVAAAFCRALGYPVEDAHPFVLEGGSIHTDGEGTILTTEACLLSGGRNPSLSKEEIGRELCRRLGAEKVIWLPRGIYNDETNEHVDNVCAFTSPGEVVLAWTDNPQDPQYALSRACLDVLERETDARGRKIKVHLLPIPQKPVTIGKEDLVGFKFEPGEDVRTEGERLAASYVNFYITNYSVLVPQFGDPNDWTAVEILSECFPGRTVIPLPARAILLGGGNIHCITQQIPLGGALR